MAEPKDSNSKVKRLETLRLQSELVKFLHGKGYDFNELSHPRPTREYSRQTRFVEASPPFSLFGHVLAETAFRYLQERYDDECPLEGEELEVMKEWVEISISR